MILPALTLALTLVAATPDSGGWLKTIRPMDWTLFTADQDATTLVFGKPARGNFGSQSPRIWIRLETNSLSPRSIVSLTQFDCLQRRYVVVQTSGFARNNMEGDPVPTGRLDDPPQWVAIEAGTLYDAVLKRFCPAPAPTPF
jgi:hypothetical protein